MIKMMNTLRADKIIFLIPLLLLMLLSSAIFGDCHYDCHNDDASQPCAACSTLDESADEENHLCCDGGTLLAVVVAINLPITPDPSPSYHVLHIAPHFIGFDTSYRPPEPLV